MGSCCFCKVSKKRLVLLSATAIAVVFVLLCRWNTGLAEWYMLKVYPVWAVVLSYFSGIFPFSLFDVLTVAVVVLFAVSIVQLLRRKIKFISWLYYLVMSVAWLVLWFYLSWGIGYFRPDYYARSGIPKVNVSIEDFKQVLLQNIDSLNISYVSIGSINKSEVDEAIEQSYAQLHNDLNLPYPNGKRRAKCSMYQGLQTKMGVTGFFNPFFNEVHVNTAALPFSYPFTLAHEKAHQLGITSEAECNLYAAIVCTSSTNGQVRYSGYYGLVSYLLSAFQKAAPDDYAAVFSLISEDVKADLICEYNFWQQAISPGLSEVQAKVYDSYLKSNKVSSGIVNYSEVVELFLAWNSYKKN